MCVTSVRCTEMIVWVGTPMMISELRSIYFFYYLCFSNISFSNCHTKIGAFTCVQFHGCRVMCKNFQVYVCKHCETCIYALLLMFTLLYDNYVQLHDSNASVMH